ncbi:choline/Carnitine o-acyltransferase domain-containing protein [Ditylenchus destructor]|uniref:Choline O-acetyltransferase n=1 Tax=Ditylenchus destructor TaxID=166010 RepID=A0AAD4MW80_9BILA|nr:choline/Carnitine o-acyltransferase domain-containing protein [Ditylenchus destructor]
MEMANGTQDGPIEDGLKNSEVESGWYDFNLPRPGVPSLEHTFERYLQYSKVLAEPLRIPIEDVELAVSKYFPVAEQMQHELKKLAESEENWINLFWLPEMYLKQRYPLPVNSNPAYIFPKQQFEDEEDQLDYAAWMVCGLMEYKDKIDKKSIPREHSTSKAGRSPLCMDQCDRILSCYREPAESMDVIHNRRINPDIYTDSDNEHILVMCNRQAFVVFTRLQSRNLTQNEIFDQLNRVCQMAENRSEETIIPIGASTIGNRESAASFWAIMKEVPTNIVSLNWIRSATFVLCLDKNESTHMSLTGDRLNWQENAGLQLLHGFGSYNNGLNRWYDATIQLIVSRTGCCGLCIEHSVAEGIVIINMCESAMRFAEERKGRRKFNKKENQNGLTPQPRPLSWVVNDEAQGILKKQRTEFDQLAKDLQLRVLTFDEFGKELIKSICFGPDGFVQLCMQLAHYRLHGQLVSTYESATIRRFRYGRVDNIRAATPEALAFAKCMMDPKATQNVNGDGIDNHLCALEVLTRQAVNNGTLAEMPELFRQTMWTELMRFPLSTSQVTTSPEFVGCYLCYGPVVQDGYGCAYNIQSDKIILAVSSYKSNARTDIGGFVANLAHALRDIAALFTSNQ